MKIIILACLFVFADYSSQAQTISKSDLTPVIGEKFLVHIYNNQPQISLENSGINQIWDLGNITRSAEVDKFYQVVDPASTPFKVPFASFAYKYFILSDSSSKGYKYFKDTINGFYGISDILPYRSNEYSNPEFIYKLPLNINDSRNDNSCYSTVLSSFYDELCGESSLKFDGTGKLILPSGTYNDVYRLVYENYYLRKSLSDTIYTKSWFWYKKGIHFPIAEYVRFTMSGINYVTINVLNQSLLNAVSSFEPAKKLIVYPNPANGKLMIKNNEKNLMGFTISIYDWNSKLIKSEKIYNNTIEFEMDLNGLKSGSYYYSIGNESESGSISKLIIK
jgi:hypothetical protein